MPAPVTPAPTASSPLLPAATAALDRFFTTFETRRAALAVRQQREALLRQQKHDALIPIRQLLKSLCDRGVRVPRAGGRPDEGVPLIVHDGEPSSAAWRPGVSLFLTHPVGIEISVVHPHEQERDGLYIVRLSGAHPERHLLEDRRFDRAEDLCTALADFLARCAVDVRPHAPA